MGKRKKSCGSSLTPQQIECTIYCAGYPCSSMVKLREELHTHFSRYSEVQRIRTKEYCTFVQFTKPEGVKEVLKHSHVIGGCKLTVQPYRPHLSATSTSMTCPDSCNVLNDCETVDQVVQVLLLKSENLQRREHILSELLSLLKPFYPEARLYLYGSTINGVGTQESDLDIHFEPFPGYFDDAHVPCRIPKPYEVETGRIPHEVFLKMPQHHHLSFIRRVFPSYQSITRVNFITAKVPIVTFNYQSHDINIQCDISCNNMLPVYNSQLLSLFSKLDSRVAPFLIIFKQWAKAHHVLKKGQLSSYALQLLGIFFLQNTEPPVVPTIAEMMSLATESRIVDGFETAFCDDVKRYPASLNTEPVEILIEQVFSFYSNFDFSLVICPKTGIATDRKEFVNATNIVNFDKSALLVQDPFEIDRNLTGNIYWNQLMDFISSCAKAERRYKANGLNRDNKPFGILNIIRESLQHGSVMHINRAALKPIKSLIDFSFRFIPPSSTTENGIHKWSNVISSAFVYIFNHALLFDARITEPAVLEPKLETAESISPSDADCPHQSQDEAGVREKKMSEVDGSDGKLNDNVKFTAPIVNDDCDMPINNEPQDVVKVSQPLDVTESYSVITYNEESNFESKLSTVEVIPHHEKSENRLATKKLKTNVLSNSAVTGPDNCHEKENKFLDDDINVKFTTPTVNDNCHDQMENEPQHLVRVNEPVDVTESCRTIPNREESENQFVNRVTAMETSIEVLVPYNAYKGRALIYQRPSGQNPLDNDHEISLVLKNKNGCLEEPKKFTCHVDFVRTNRKKKNVFVMICSEGDPVEDLPLATFLRIFLTVKMEELFENDFDTISKFLLESHACDTFVE